MNTAPISGTQELLPEIQITFNRLKDEILEVYRKHGFIHIETPVIERLEILNAKAGGDTEKQIYKVFKTAETADEADQALRFDHTVPLARYVVQHENELVFPFKVTQIGRNFRGERAQKGRFREFYQCDVDVIGRGELPIEYDADVIATLLYTFFNFKLKTRVLARINNRKILTGFLEGLGLSSKSADIFSIIDHSEKVPEEKTREAFSEIGLDEEQIRIMTTFMNIHGNRTRVLKELEGVSVDNQTFKEGVNELDRVLYHLESEELGESVEGDMKIVRGLDYYTGTVFEFNLPEYKEVGSVCGGGRYENLAEYFTEQKLPGVGGSIGLSRLFYVLNEHNLIENQEEKVIGYAVIPISDNEIPFSLWVARELRKKGETVTVVLTKKKLGDKLAYAAKLAKKGIVIGDDEVRTGNYEIKEFN